jgi:soluble lytic murein transglycosylase-like protein
MATSAQYQRAARRAARQYNLPFFVRQIRQESGFRDVRSPMGAQGPAQLMPATARSLGVNPHGKRAIWAAARLMRGYVDKYGVEGALRAYNAGPGAIQASHGYAETNAYVRTSCAAATAARHGRRRHGRRAWVPGTPGTPGTVIPGVAALRTCRRALRASSRS